MANTQRIGNVTIDYTGVPANMLSSVKSTFATLCGDAQTSDLIQGQNTSYRIAFSNGDPAKNATTSGGGENAVTTFNINNMHPDGAGGVVMINSNGVAKPFEITAVHEAVHVEFPDFSGDTRIGHDNAVGDYLFRTITIDTANRLFGNHDSDENAARTSDLADANQNDAFLASGIKLDQINNTAQAINILRDENSGIKQFLSPKAQKDEYDAPDIGEAGAYKYKSQDEDGNNSIADYSTTGVENSVYHYDQSGNLQSVDIYAGGNYNFDGANINIMSGELINISGTGDVIQLQSNADNQIGVFGQNQTVNGDTGNDVVNLGGDGTTATVNGGGTVGLINNGQSLMLGDSGSTVNTAPAVVNEVISGSGEGINLTANSAANIDGSGNTINLNTGDSIAVHGGGNTINGGADERIYVGNTDGNPDTLNVSNDRENSDAIDHQTTGIFFGPQTQASLNGTGDGYSSAPGDQITSPDDFMSDYEGNAPFDNGYYSGDDPSSSGQGDDPGGSDGSTSPGSPDGSDGSDGSINPGSADGSDGSTSPGNSDGSDGSIGADGGDDGGFFGGFGEPLILDLAHGGVQTVNADHSPARFDMGNDGSRVQTGWGTPGEAYLVDLPSGAQTPTDAADLVPTFEALRAADTNHDSVLDAHDAGWSNLKVWVDASGTAVSDPGSLHSLGDLGIVSIDLNATPDGRLDHGNTILADGRFTWADGSRGDIADVALRFRTNPSPVSNGPAAIDPGTQTQASQLVAALSTFGVSPAAESTVQTAPPSGQIALTVDPTAAQARRLAA
ncbi:hypothetical protein MKK64_12100 [Methylobacterium sp. E-025]|uniref:hypothetical protein n=1 Tax=Methylobacterium sp. E-025 TaxID=2836561 RepID=UPI001FBAD95E|nr:hypothetical protein [Methylobacterium sp. E-025]MCJ2111937.1 hypothetical protein [Methylobacterium sp. E-025]